MAKHEKQQISNRTNGCSDTWIHLFDSHKYLCVCIVDSFYTAHNLHFGPVLRDLNAKSALKGTSWGGDAQAKETLHKRVILPKESYPWGASIHASGNIVHIQRLRNSAIGIILRSPTPPPIPSMHSITALTYMSTLRFRGKKKAKSHAQTHFLKVRLFPPGLRTCIWIISNKADQHDQNHFN